MVRIALGGILAVGLMAGNARGGAQDGARKDARCELAVIWHDAYRLHPLDGDAVRQEVARVLGNSGISLCWQDGETAPRAEAILTVRAILMPHDGSSWNLPRRTLGATLGASDPRRSSFVLFPNVVDILGYDAGSMGLAERALLSRALGRVVAHELIHATLPDHPHADEGVFQEHLMPRLLTRAGARIDPLTTGLLLAKLQALESVADASGTGAGATGSQR